jgi:hypothetical protein
MDKLQLLKEELRRFNNIGKYVKNLNEGNEVTLGLSSGSGFVKPQGGSERAKLYKTEFTEQEEEIEVVDEPVEEPIEEPIEDVEEFVDDIELEDDLGLEGFEDTIDEPTEDSTEVDVTELVSKQDETNAELSGQKDILQKNTDSLNDLMDKLGELEGHLGSMDDMVNKISDLENKLDEYRPKTPEEKLRLRKHDSGPYNKTLSDFFVDKEETFKETGKKEYILTPEDVDNYSDIDIKKSFGELGD